MSYRERVKSLLAEHANLYSAHEKPLPLQMGAMINALVAQRYHEDKLEFSLETIGKSAGRKFPTIGEIKIAGAPYRPPAKSSSDEGKARENTVMYRKYFDSVIEAIGREAFIQYLIAYVKKVFTDSEAAKEMTVDYKTASLDQIFNAIITRMALRHLKNAKGNPTMAISFGMKGA